MLFGDRSAPTLIHAIEGARINPSLHSHSAGKVQGVAGRHGDVAIGLAVELKGTAVLAGRCPGGVRNRAVIVVAGGVGRGCAGAFAETVGCNESGWGSDHGRCLIGGTT